MSTKFVWVQLEDRDEMSSDEYTQKRTRNGLRLDHNLSWASLSGLLGGSGTRVPPPVQEVVRSNLGWGSLRVWAVSCPISYNTGWA